MSQNPQDPRAIARKQRQAKALKANMKRRKEATRAVEKPVTTELAKKGE